MKRIRKSRAARILSWLLTVAMIAPLVSGLVAPRAAQAQQASIAAGGVQTVIVIDFDNRSGFGGDALARFATDAVAVEMASSARFEVLKRDEVTRAASELGLRAPYDTIGLTKIAQQLGATGIVTGELAKVWVDAKASPKTVSVGLKIRVLEAGSGDLVNGSAEIGEARAKPGESDNQSLAQDATRSAATLGVRDLLQYTLPEGIVLHSVGQGGVGPSVQVLINRGSRDGVKEGMDMIILRDHQRVGKIRVSRVFPTDSEALITENMLGVRPEDRVRAVFPMPDFLPKGVGVVRRAPGRRDSLKSLAAVATVIVLGLVIAEAARGSQSTVTGVVSEPELVGITPAVRITWRDSIWGQGAAVLEHHVWRNPDASFNPTGTPVAATSGLNNQYVDLSGGTGFWNGTNSFLQAPFPPGGTTGTGGTSGATATSKTPTAGAVPGPRLGVTYVYQVSAVLRTTTQSTGGTGGTGGTGTTVTNDVESTPVSSGAATLLPQPQPSSPTNQQQNVDLRSVSFVWPSVTGADQFVVEVTTAANSTFKNTSLIFQIPVASSAPFSNGVPQTLAQPINLTTNPILRRDGTFLAWVTGAPGAAQPTLLWRVGARNSQDRPGPVDWITGNPHAASQGSFRYIYSQAFTFTPAVLPPNPPG